VCSNLVGYALHSIALRRIDIKPILSPWSLWMGTFDISRQDILQSGTLCAAKWRVMQYKTADGGQPRCTLPGTVNYARLLRQNDTLEDTCYTGPSRSFQLGLHGNHETKW